MASDHSPLSTPTSGDPAAAGTSYISGDFSAPVITQATGGDGYATIVPGLYPFSSATFGTCGATGRLGPSNSSACTASYSQYGLWTGNPAYLSVAGGIQTWTVPRDGNYRCANTVVVRLLLRMLRALLHLSLPGAAIGCHS